MNLRAAVPADAEAIVTIWHSGWLDGHLGHVPDAVLPYRTLDAFRERVPLRLAEITVAELDGTVAGFVLVHDDEVEQIYVAAGARGSGIATALLAHGEQVIAESFDVAWLSVVAGNARARRFYARSGWTDAGPFDYEAYTADGRMILPCHRYEIRVR